MTVDESDITKIIAEVEATSRRLRKTIRDRDLAATHRLRQMRHLRMLEEQKVWKRETGFDYNKTAAEIDARRSRTNLVSEPFFYRNMFNPRRQHTSDEFTLEMRVDFEGLRMKTILSQPEPPLQCNTLLRKASEARIDTRLRRCYLIVLRIPKIFTLACLLLSSI